MEEQNYLALSIEKSEKNKLKEKANLANSE